jgi:putative hydrolase of the HAD superfamily
MSPIKNIIFDFGDVFLNLDKTAPAQHLKTHGIETLDDKTIRIHKDYEKGLISTDEFVAYHLKTYNRLTEPNFVEAWNSILIDFPEHRLDFLKKLKDSNNFKLFLLSNTNDLHIKWVKYNIPFYDSFRACFNEFYLSYEINLRKPDPDIFEFVLLQNNLNVHETLFIDDTLEHINSAKNLNLQTWHLQAGQEDVVDLFEQKHLNF